MKKEDQDEKILAAAKAARVYDFIDARSALENTKEKLGLSNSDQKARRIGFNPMLRIAASIVVAIGIGFAIYQNQSGPGWTEIASGESIKEYKLPDGSVVTLNRNSSLRVAMDMQDNRRVELDGEAFFDVSGDETRPFIIAAGEVNVEVLGTSFNVKSALETTEVSVASGKVKVSENGNESNHEILVKNQSVAFRNNTNALIRRASDPNYLAWKTGIYSFQNVPAQTAIQQLADHHKVTVAFLNSDDIVKCTITSVFDNQSWEEITEEISLIHSFEFNTQNDTTFISGSNCQ